MPTMDDIINDLNGAKVFSKLDLNHGYHQLEIHPDSRHITTFSTHVGLRRYKRLSFGINAASEIFQNAIQQVLSGIHGVRNISDDIIVFGRTVQEHDNRLEQVMARLKEYNLTLNKTKCEFHKNSIDFFGQVFSEKGMSPDPKKVNAIKNAEAPKSQSEVRSFLGLTNYCSRFLQNYADITKPLRELTHKACEFKWNQKHQVAFDAIKKKLTDGICMAYYDPCKKTQIIIII